MSLILAEKYDRAADRFAENTYANLAFDMHRRLKIVTEWGIPLERGDSVLELGCGDGYLAQLLVQHGLNYHGADVSPKMVANAEQRLKKPGLKGEFIVVAVDEMVLSQPFDAIVSYMGAFFTFVQDPSSLLRRLRPRIRKKIILDLNPRGRIDVTSAIEMLTAAGFRKVTWRPFFVPVAVKLPHLALRALALAEEIPILRNLPMRWKFNVLVKGEAGFAG
jgi:SAM-dependent methyltransferase